MQVPVFWSQVPPGTVLLATEQAPELVSHFGAWATQTVPVMEHLGAPQSASLVHLGGGLHLQILQPVLGSRWNPCLQCRVQLMGGQGSHLPALQVWSALQSF